jgi:hypothetical protein
MILNSCNFGSGSTQQQDNKRLLQKNLQRWSRMMTEIAGLEEILEYMLPGSNEYRNYG